MAIRVKLPNGKYGSFPDDMPHDQIESVLKNQFPPEPKQPEQSFLNKLPRNIMAGAARGIAGFANIPYEIGAMSGSNMQKPDGYEQRLLDASGSQPSFNPERIPHINNHDYSKMFGITGEPTLADEAIQFGTEFALPLGGTGKLAYKGAKSIVEHMPAITTKGIAREVSAGKQLAKEKYSGLYKSLFENAEKKGLTEIKAPDINARLIEKSSMPKYHTALKEFMSKPTVENAHKAQSDLGKLSRAMEKSDAINPLTSTQQKVYRSVQDARSKIQDSMFKDHPVLGKRYNEITSGYRKEVVPYTTNKALNLFDKNELGHKKLVQRLKNNDAFMLTIGKQYPGIKINDLLKNKLGHSILKGVMQATGMKGFESLIQ